MKEPTLEQWHWRIGSDHGVSSETIWHTMTGVPLNPREWPGVPYDDDDFGHCYRLLKLFSEWRPRLGEVADLYPDWAPIVEHWDELSALYEDHNRMAVYDLLHRLRFPRMERAP